MTNRYETSKSRVHVFITCLRRGGNADDDVYTTVTTHTRASTNLFGTSRRSCRNTVTRRDRYDEHDVYAGQSVVGPSGAVRLVLAGAQVVRGINGRSSDPDTTQSRGGEERAKTANATLSRVPLPPVRPSGPSKSFRSNKPVITVAYNI